ncbi:MULTISPECIES: Cna B-type domain-containing protein [unclassified Parvimonas]|uniref:Cna B-type domain-containing protein n=1 Tax=unclassified Parvimonas TaxID=1151464 RepID=UPI002B46B56D|nr:MULTISPECIES: Cna B-type domain-containing protein [unclassified Parvimonas]MEB3025615.1 Cna B-type domain-containing protein [Parvimonas sp. M13]MEB3089751.1 Cna B-type domain-containing protein [Parvimonas sp. M20]
MKRILSIGLLVFAIFIGSFSGLFAKNEVFAKNNGKSSDEKIDIAVQCKWVGDDDNSRTVKVDLLIDDVVINTVAITKGSDWKHVFEGLDKNNPDGTPINYNIKLHDENHTRYKAKITGDIKNGFIINCSELRTIYVTKYWNREPDISPAMLNPDLLNSKSKKASLSGVKQINHDKLNSKVPMPDSITIYLLADGKVIDTAVLTEDDDWEYAFIKKPLYDEKDGHEIEYKVLEKPVKGYKAEYDYFDIINKSVFDIPVEKKWIGAPKDEVEVTLYRDHDEREYNPQTQKYEVKKITETVATVKLNKANNWKYTFKDVEEFFLDEEFTHKYKYYIKEKTIDGYESVITGDEDKGFTITNKNKNETSPAVVPTIDVKVESEFLGEDRKEITAPVDKIEVELYRNGEPTGQKLVLSKANNWKGEFKDLKVYESEENQKPYEYTVKEVGEDNKNLINLASKLYSVVYSGNMKDGIKIQNIVKKEDNKKVVTPEKEQKLPKTAYDINAIMSLGMMTVSGIALGVLGNKRKNK